MAAVSSFPDDFERQQLDIMQRRKKAQEGQQFNAMPGQMVSGHYVAPHFTQILAEGLRGYSDIQGEKKADQELKDLIGKRQSAMTGTMSSYIDALRGAPEQRAPMQADYFDEADRATLGGNQDLTSVTPARAADPMAANQVLMSSQFPAFQQMGMTQFNQYQQNQAAQQQKIADQQAAQQQAQAKQAQLSQLWQESGGDPQKFLAATGGSADGMAFAKTMVEGQNLGQPTVARTVTTVDARGREVTQQLDSRGNPVGAPIPVYKAPPAPREPKAPNVIQTATGPMILGNDGSARPIMGVDGRPVQGAKSENVTESERKSGTLLTRLRGSQAQLADVIAKNPSAASPSLVGQTLSGMGMETAGNLLTSSDRQRVNAAQLDLLDAALTLGTGAAYTREQLEGYRKSFFPQLGDSAATIKDKEDRLKNVIAAAEVAAGRAESQSMPRFGPGSAPPNSAPQGRSNINSILDKYK